MADTVTQTRDVSDTVAVVDVLRDMDLNNAKEIKDVFMRLMNLGRTTVVANLRNVALIDSSGLEALASVQVKARSMGVNFYVVCSNPNLLKLFGITGMDQELKIFASEEDALRGVTA